MSKTTKSKKSILIETEKISETDTIVDEIITSRKDLESMEDNFSHRRNTTGVVKKGQSKVNASKFTSQSP